jgi:lactoylglutathione lyase
MLPNRLSLVMIYVSDMERSVAFYRDTLGLPLRFQSPDWSEFATEAVTLALHGGGAPRQGPPPAGGLAAGTVATGFQVEDIRATFTALSARGVRFVMEPKLQEHEGIWLAVFLDPDGCPLSLSQRIQQ